MSTCLLSGLCCCLYAHVHSSSSSWQFFQHVYTHVRTCTSHHRLVLAVTTSPVVSFHKQIKTTQTARCRLLTELRPFWIHAEENGPFLARRSGCRNGVLCNTDDTNDEGKWERGSRASASYQITPISSVLRDSLRHTHTVIYIRNEMVHLYRFSLDCYWSFLHQIHDWNIPRCVCVGEIKPQSWCRAVWKTRHTHRVYVRAR